MDNESQQVPPVESQPPVKTSNNLNFAKVLAYGFIIVSIGISIAVGGYLLGVSKTKSQPASKILTPTPLPTEASAKAGDPTANWKTYRAQSLGLEFKLPPKMILLGGEPNEAIIPAPKGFPGTKVCMTFQPKSSGDWACRMHIFIIGTTSNDWRVPGDGPSFTDLGGFIIKEGKYYAKFYVDKVGKEIEISSELIREIKNQNGINMIKVIGKDDTIRRWAVLTGTPGYGNIGALINTDNKTYPGFAVQMEFYQEWDEKTFDQILSTFKFTP